MTPTFVVLWNGNFHHATEDREQARRVARHLIGMGAHNVTIRRYNISRDMEVK